MTNKITQSKKKISPSGKALGLIFAAAVAFSAVVYLIICLALGDKHFTDIFFIGGKDFFMDFFNSIRDAAQGSGVYSERGVIYPPMANLIFLALSRFTPSEYDSTSFADRGEWTQYVPCLVLVLVSVSVCAILLFALVHKFQSGEDGGKKLLCSSAIMLSVPMLYLFERGNILVLCLAALLVYAITFNSKSALWREIGLLALAFAFSLKLYPVVFGWMLLVNKRFKESLRCALYGVLMIIIPSVFFGGPIFCVKYLFGNIFNFSTGTGNDIGKLMDHVGMSQTLQSVMTILIYLWVLICAACFVISSVMRKENAQRLWILGVATILCVPSLTGIYNWIFFTIPLIMIFNKNRPCKRDIAYFIMIAIPYLFIPFRINHYLNPTDVAVFVLSAAVSIFAVIDTLTDVLKRQK